MSCATIVTSDPAWRVRESVKQLLPRRTLPRGAAPSSARRPSLASPSVDAHADQLGSCGSSQPDIVERAIEAARPQAGLRWLDIGCGRGELLRAVRDRWHPAQLWGIDAIDWLDDDLRADVEFRRVAAESADGLPAADRVMLVEVIEHLEAPWTALRRAAQLVAPGGRIVVSTPNLATLRHRLELALRGRLTNFRPDNEPHMSPALPHVMTRVLSEEGLRAEAPRFAGADVISLTKGRVWPRSIRARYPQLTCVSVIVAAERPR
jgi:2-polyprenyl-3-methyl-5-hydroxy-6-metoxy-1,4-benzoquinol methylase